MDSNASLVAFSIYNPLVIRLSVIIRAYNAVVIVKEWGAAANMVGLVGKIPLIKEWKLIYLQRK